MTTPDHYTGRSNEAGAAMRTIKQPFLPYEIVQVLRGERGYTENSKDIAELAISYYRAGRSGRAYDPPRVPGFPSWSMEMMDHFLWTCWRYGRADSPGVEVVV